MTTVYELIQDCRILDGTPYIAYGLVARTADNRILAMIRDVTTDRLQAENFAKLCNSMNLSPEHLGDVVADFIVA